MKSLADGLPPEIAQQIHPDWSKNEAAYWAVRDQLLRQYRGQWIGFADGAIIVAAPTPLEVFLAVQQSGRHPFVIRVGHEDEPWYRIRRTSFSYDTAYPSAALPVVSAEFRAASGSTGLLLDRVRCCSAAPQGKSSSIPEKSATGGGLTYGTGHEQDRRRSAGSALPWTARRSQS